MMSERPPEEEAAQVRSMNFLNWHKRVLQGTTLVVCLSASVVGLLAFAQSWAPPDEYKCFQSVAQSQFPKWLGCVMAAHEGLAGGLIGGAGALFAGWLAFASVQRQLEEERNNRDRERQEAKGAAVVAIAHVVHAAALVLRSVRQAQAAVTLAEEGNAEELLCRGIGYVETALQNFVLREVAGDLGADDRAIFICIIGTLSTMVDISKTRGVSRKTYLDGLGHALLNTRNYLLAFNDELAAVFDKDAELVVSKHPADTF